MISKINCTIWNRDFDLDVIYDVYKGESVTEAQKVAFDSFQKNMSSLLVDSSKVCEYCLKQNKEDIPNGTIENIFKYVIPQKIYVCRSSKRKVALLCAYKFDPEHGIAVVFENEKLVTIGQQDIVLSIKGIHDDNVVEISQSKHQDSDFDPNKRVAVDNRPVKGNFTDGDKAAISARASFFRYIQRNIICLFTKKISKYFLPFSGYFH